MPDLAEQDHRRALRAPAQRAGLAAAAIAPLPRVFVITGPSGVGKGTLIRRLRERVPELGLAVSATTRSPRAGEEDGVDYWFLDHEEFFDRVHLDEFVEWAEYSGRWYGTLRSELERHTSAGNPVLLEIEVQGAREVRRTLPEAIQIFIAPPSPEDLEVRLARRGTDDARAMEQRLAYSAGELEARGEFTHVVVNDDLDEASAELEGLVRGALHSES